MRESKASHNQVGRTCLALSYLSHMYVLLLGRPFAPASRGKRIPVHSRTAAHGFRRLTNRRSASFGSGSCMGRKRGGHWKSSAYAKHRIPGCHRTAYCVAHILDTIYHIFTGVLPQRGFSQMYFGKFDKPRRAYRGAIVARIMYSGVCGRETTCVLRITRSHSTFKVVAFELIHHFDSRCNMIALLSELHRRQRTRKFMCRHTMYLVTLPVTFTSNYLRSSVAIEEGRKLRISLKQDGG